MGGWRLALASLLSPVNIFKRIRKIEMTAFISQAVRDYAEGAFTVANLFQIGVAIAVSFHFGSAALMAFWGDN